MIVVIFLIIIFIYMLIYCNINEDPKTKSLYDAYL